MGYGPKNVQPVIPIISTGGKKLIKFEQPKFLE